MIKQLSAAVLTTLMLSTSAWASGIASSLNITAEFSPRVSGANATQFVNTTPLSGYCHGNTSHCRPGDFTIMFPLTIQRQWVNPGPIEGHNYHQVDGNWKTISVNHEAGGPPTNVDFRLNLLARRYLLGSLQPGGIGGNIGPIANGAGISGASQGGCVGRLGAGSGTQYSFAWGVPNGFNRCTRPPTSVAMGPYNGTIDQVSIGYELRTPTPFELQNGLYRGEITYTVGPGQQIDLGNGTYSDTSVTFHFELKVEHRLRIDFPPGSEHAVLEPPGGWSQWVNRGITPTRLFRDHPFQIWASAPTKMYLLCNDVQIGAQCGIAEQNRAAPLEVPIEVAVSLPETMQHNGASVNRLPIPVGEPNALVFHSIGTAIGRRGGLHYSVAQADVARMLTRTGSTFKGDVTLIVDAQM